MIETVEDAAYRENAVNSQIRVILFVTTWRLSANSFSKELPLLEI